MDVAALYRDPTQWPVFSAETFPTENSRSVDSVIRAVEELIPHRIRVVTTTWGALGSLRGGTPSLSRIIREKFRIPTVVHLNIQAKTKRDIENILRGLHLDDLHNVFALGGDPPLGVADYVPAELRHTYACDLVDQVVHLNRGLWLGEDGAYTRQGLQTRFRIGVAGFPEIHPDDYQQDESLKQNMERNIEHLKTKVTAGADYIVEQMTFSAEHHFRYQEAARKAGIDLPIIPGILPFDRFSQASRFIGDTLRISMPEELRLNLEAATEERQASLAAENMADLVQQLLDSGVPGIHFYCMNRPGPTIELLSRLRL